MKCPFIVKLMGPEVSLEDVQCPDVNQKCWSCKVGPAHQGSREARAMKLALWAAGPPAGRAEDEFRAARVRRVQDGREYARLTTGPAGQEKALANVATMLRWEGWADVQVLQEGA